MDGTTKIQLSQEQRDLLKNTDWIFSKRLILKKAENLLAQVQQKVQKTLEEQNIQHIDPRIVQKSKIARGENYKGLPWLMLDYPAIFDKRGIRAIRTMFWWGNAFFCTLHVSGKHMPPTNILEKWITEVTRRDYYVCVGDGEWVHDLNPEAYRRAAELSVHQRHALLEKPFFKAATHFPVDDFLNARQALPHCICYFLEILTTANAVD